MTYFSNAPEGKVAYHINGEVTDNHLYNIGFTDRSSLGKKTGHKSKSMAVFKIDKNGNEIEVYRSAREAGKKNFMSYQTVLDRCNHKVKNEFALLECSFRWCEEIENYNFRDGCLRYPNGIPVEDYA